MSLPLLATDLEEQKRALVLIPVTSGVTGAFGTKWTADLAIFNPTDEPVPVTWGPCPITLCHYALSPGQQWHELNVQPGFLIYRAPEFLSFALTVRETTRGCSGWGTRIPTPRLSEFVETFRLIDIPTTPEVRTNLRLYLYAPEDFIEAAHWVIRVLDAESQEVLAEESAGGHKIAGVEHLAMGDLISRYPQIVEADRVIVEVNTAGHEHATAWGFLTVTDSVSQQVTVIEP